MKINWIEEKENLIKFLKQGYTYSQIAKEYNLSCHKSIKKQVVKLEIENYYNPIYTCTYCNEKFTNKQQYMGHISCCDKNPNYDYDKKITQLENARKNIKHTNNKKCDDFVCQFCEKHISNKGSLVAHEKTCKLNPDRIEDWRKNNLGDYSKFGHIGSNQFIKSDKLGLPKPEVSQETRDKLREITTQRNLIYWSTEENKKKHSKIMSDVVKMYPDSYSSSNVNGRVKKVDYKGIKLDSSWEYIVAETLDYNSIKWVRPTVGFEYNWNNSTHLYFPDFYLPEYDLYIEVKGYEREKDRKKYTSVCNLILIKQDEIKNIKQDITFIKKLIENNKK